jgi:hypothetical protein
MFQLRFYTWDQELQKPDFVIERNVFNDTGEFDDLEQVYDRIENIGSKWIFYPFPVIFRDDELYEIAYNENETSDSVLQLMGTVLKDHLSKWEMQAS